MENVDSLFAEANSLIASLPVVGASNGWWDCADVRSAEKLEAWRRGGERLLTLAEQAPSEKVNIFRDWASDAFLGTGNISRALDTRPAPVLGSRSSARTDRILTVKHAICAVVRGADIATIFGPRFTAFGLENIEPITKFLDIRVSTLQQQEKRNLLAEWSADAHKHPSGGMSLFPGHASYIHVPSPQGLSFSLSPTAELFCVQLMRDAENTFRDERNIPRIGEGWVAEVALFYDVKAAFETELVVQHARPEWLGRQHLDIYLPDRSIALEYQGEQHDRPVAFFGGEEAFRKNVERDRVKLAKCRRHGVRIIYVRGRYDFASLLEEISLLSR